MLGLVAEMRAAVFHFRDASIGIVWMGPFLVAAFLRTLPIDARQIGPRRRGDARRLDELRQELVIRVAVAAPHDGAQGRVRFQRRGIDSDGLAADQAPRPPPPAAPR